MNDKKATLFSHFPPNTQEEWEEVVKKDLKGSSFEANLITKNADNIKIKPIYFTKTDSPNYSAKTSLNNWLISEFVKVDHIEMANNRALVALNNGANAIVFDLQNKTFDIDELNRLFKDIKIEFAPVYLKNAENTPLLFDFLAAYFKTIEIPQLLSNVGSDPLASLENGLPVDKKNIDKILANITPFSKYSTINVNGTRFKEAGGNIIHELGFTIAKGLAYLEKIKDKNLAFLPIQFTLATGSDFFMEIAKIRAFRLLFQGLLTHFDFPKQPIHIHVKSCSINKTIFDGHTNILRNTTEAMSAILGGADSICILPFGEIEVNADFDARISRNIQNILQHESYFDKVKDMVSGSGYIERLTEEICDKVWQLLLSIEKMGGYENAYNQGFVEAEISKNRSDLEKMVAERKIILLGTNSFPNTTEPIKQKIETTPKAKGLSVFRLADPFESLKIKTNIRFLETGKRPTVFLLATGNLAIRKARMNFASNYFSIGGFEIIESKEFVSIEEAISKIPTIQADYFVLTSDDASWETWIPPIFDAVGKSKFVLAGKAEKLPIALKDIDIQYFIYEGNNILNQLTKMIEIL